MIIYKSTNKVNGKIYIGMTTKSLQERINGHKKNYKYTTYAFHRALLKYGFENFSFEVIDTADSVEALINKECLHIKEHDSMNPRIGYNMIAQDDHVKFFTDDVRKKISKAQIDRMKAMPKEVKRVLYEKLARTRQGEKRNENKKYVGVFKNKYADSYEASITFKTDSSQRYRKVFPNESVAAQAYDKIALYLYGEKATLNFPESKSDYYKEDLEAFADWFLHCPYKVGRRSVKSYPFVRLLQDAKKNAKNILYAKLVGKNVTVETIDSLIDIRFHWDGTPYNVFIQS